MGGIVQFLGCYQTGNACVKAFPVLRILCYETWVTLSGRMFWSKENKPT